MQKITSRQNEEFKLWSQCLDSKGVQTHHMAILAGKKATEDTLKRHSKEVIAVLVPENMSTDIDHPEQFSLDEKLFKIMDVSGTGQPLLVVKVPDFKILDSKILLKGCSVYLTLQDPRNIGAVLRSAAAFNVSNIILGDGAAHPFHPLSLRAASGCVLDLKYFKSSGELNISLKSFTTVALDMDGKNLAEFKFPKDFILVPGTEGPGLEQSFLPSHRVHINISKNAESLNAAAATAIALYEWSKQRV